MKDFKKIAHSDYTKMKDEQLISLLKKRDQRAFQVFYDRFFDSIYRFCFYRLGCRHPDTEDVVGEVMLTAVNKIDSLYEQEDTRIFNWLAQIARFKLMEFYRRHKRSEAERVFSSFDEDLESFLEGSVTNNQDSDQLPWSQESIGVVLNSLPDDYQYVLRAKYLQDLSVREIASRMDRSEKAIESLLTRSREAFRKLHKKYSQSSEGLSDG